MITDNSTIEEAEETVEAQISIDQEIRLREQGLDVLRYLHTSHSTEEPTWMFVGKYAMPNSNHLIPFRI